MRRQPLQHVIYWFWANKNVRRDYHLGPGHHVQHSWWALRAKSCLAECCITSLCRYSPTKIHQDFLPFLHFLRFASATSVGMWPPIRYTATVRVLWQPGERTACRPKRLWRNVRARWRVQTKDTFWCEMCVEHFSENPTSLSTPVLELLPWNSEQNFCSFVWARHYGFFGSIQAQLMCVKCFKKPGRILVFSFQTDTSIVIVWLTSPSL